MGIIVKQSIRGTIFSYIGVLLGFITVGLLWPKLLTPDQIGLINFLIAMATIMAQFGGLGLNAVIIRLFPYFRNAEKKHHGFFSFIMIFTSLGFLILAGFYFIYKSQLIQNNVEKSELIVHYIDYLLPFTLALLLFNLFDNYNKVLYDAVSGTFAKELLFRFLNLVLIIVFYLQWISFPEFMFVYLLAFSSPTIYLLILLKKRNEIHINFDSFKFIHQKNLKKQIISVSSFGLIGGIGTIAVASIDKVMINEYLNLEAIGIYSTSFLFATLVAIPSRTLGKISGALIADSWKNNNLHQIDTIYKKSCLNQLVVGLFIFLLITTNLDVLYNIIPQEYQKGREVILFIGLAKLFDMATGTNGTIISTSKYYRYQSIFVFVLLFFIIGTNIIFIPWMGITGAAIASAISTFLYNTIRFVFLKLKYNLQPFNWRFLAVVAIGFILYYVFNNYMEIDNIIFNFLITSGLITIIYGLFIYLTNISEDITKIIESLLKFKNSSDK